MLLAAIHRVLRIGQTKETHVWRFIMKNTVEERIYDLVSNRRVQVSDAPTDLAAKKGKGEKVQDVDMFYCLNFSVPSDCQ
jgi:SWI/SNF-related matrix-associated actin-dependent regulator of chromatin subfamily A3